MTKFHARINGSAVALDVEPRFSLADVLREKLHLTGTHLGCEQGVCGACTILVDGSPVRSCIGSAAACDGSAIRTIEHFDDDPLMTELRQAFNAHHALQCGFCTPGMLIMARDIVQRLGAVDEDRIRLELSGNLCRCTGYAGIVKAVSSVAAKWQAEDSVLYPPAPGLGPVGSGHGVVTLAAVESGEKAVATRPAIGAEVGRRPMPSAILDKQAPTVNQSFVIDQPPDAMWRKFADVPAMVACIPGATLLEAAADGSYRIRLRMKMGPIGAEFSGLATQERDDKSRVGVIHGSGQDTRSSSLARGELRYTLTGGPDGAGTRIDIEVKYALAGALAQFARRGIVAHFVGAITSQFADNLRRSLSSDGSSSNAAHPPARQELSLAVSLRMAFTSWLGEWWRRLLRHSPADR